MESPCIVRKKINVRATISPHLWKKMNRLVDKEEEFSSVSDLISVAVTEFLVKFP
jgi:Arc/MetJ-type ribon-helix-helix transcriptional regulator